MIKFTYFIVAILASLFTSCVSNELSELDYGQNPPGSNPEIFLPGTVSTELTEHGTVSFLQDGNEVFWAVIFNDPFRKKIMTMNRVDDHWTEPQIASFSLGENEGNPFCSPDGNIIFFTGWRAASGYNEDKHLIMYSEKTDTGWNEPKLIDPIINSICKYWQISVAENNNLYFVSEIDGKGIYYSQMINGQYTSPTKIDLNIIGGTPCIASDETYIIFSASDQPDGYGELDLYISYKLGNGLWSNAFNLGANINSKFTEIWPIVSPDKKYLFFTSSKNGNMDIYWVSSTFIEELKPKE